MSELGFVHRYEEGTAPLTLLLLHGTGGDENDLIPLGRWLAPDANLLSPRGKVSENGMPRFFRRLAEGIFDVEDLKGRSHELAQFVAEAAGLYGFDPSEVCAVGYSNGANIAASTMLLHPAAFRRAALMHAMVPFTGDLPDLSGTNVMITAGKADNVIPPGHPEQLAQMLGSAGATVRVEWLPGGHELTQHEAALVKDWLTQPP